MTGFFALIVVLVAIVGSHVLGWFFCYQHYVGYGMAPLRDARAKLKIATDALYDISSSLYESERKQQVAKQALKDMKKIDQGGW